MCSRKSLQAVAVALACLGTLIPNSLVSAQQPSSARPTLTGTDLAMDAAGRIVGTVVDAAGQPSAGRTVILLTMQNEVARSLTDSNGTFTCVVPGGGVYEVAVEDHVTLVRCWVDGTAPPHARQSLLVQPSDVVRGQISPAACGLSNPWVISGIVLTAIIIPVALHNNREDRGGGS